MSSLLACTGLGKRFGERWIFRNLAFALNQGDVLIVTGANGSGKSTLLQLIAGLQQPTQGEVTGLEGDFRTNTSYAAIDQAVYPALTVAEHLELAGNLRGCPARTDGLLARVGLSNASGLLASQLSTGMRGRLKLALAIQPEPAVLLLDEPGAGLDEHGRGLVLDIINEQRARGVAVLATNDSTERRLGNLELKLAD